MMQAAVLSCSRAVSLLSLGSASTTSSRDHRRAQVERFASGHGSFPAGVRLARLVSNGQRNRRRAGSSVSLDVVAEAAVAVKEDAPVVTTETIERPKKIGKGVVRLRLTRLGRKKRPFYRIVATHYSWRRDGKYIELLGHYNPLHAKDDLGLVVKADRIKYWLGVGAQPSDTVTGILYKVGILKKGPGESF